MTRKLLAIGFLSSVIVIPTYAAKRRPGNAQPEQPKIETLQAEATPQHLEQMPAVPPQVTFNAGELTIKAQNSTLSDILKAVASRTGASMDTPGNANERVVGNFGPGPARDVLTSLLNGTHFNYVLLGSANNPEALDRVVLMAKTAGSTAPPPTEQANNAFQPAGQVQPLSPAAAPGTDTVTVAGEDSPDDSSSDDDAQSADDTADQTDSADDQSADQTDDTTNADQTADGAAVDQQQNVKTPEQMLQELQQRQQQIQQQMQQGIRPGMPPGYPPMTPGAGVPGAPYPGQQPPPQQQQN